MGIRTLTSTDEALTIGANFNVTAQRGGEQLYGPYEKFGTGVEVIKIF
jgi:hypothetical protein